jgi:hypothetical protein
VTVDDTNSYEFEEIPKSIEIGFEKFKKYESKERYFNNERYKFVFPTM